MVQTQLNREKKIEELQNKLQKLYGITYKIEVELAYLQKAGFYIPIHGFNNNKITPKKKVLSKNNK